MSDTHLEFYNSGHLGPSIPVYDDELDTVLLLAGDIGVAMKPESYTDFLYEMSERFMYVVYIAGNHEFYGGSLVNGRDIINKHIRGLDNVEMVEREVLEFDGVRVLAATLWTDFDGANPISMQTAQQFMSDYRTIRTGNADDPTSHRLYADDLLHDFKKSRDFIFDELDNAKKDGKRCVVMTHHAPSRLSISPQFLDSDINGAFVSDLANAIIDTDYEFTWVHGHVHQNHDYMLGKCRVICNPYGYHNENNFFNPELEIDV